MKTPLDDMAAAATLEVTDAMIRYLNELVKTDPEAMCQLAETRVPCNEALANHPTVQVSAGNVVGLIGILNGFLGVDHDGWGFLCAEYNDEGKLIKFKRTPPRVPKDDDVPNP